MHRTSLLTLLKQYSSSTLLTEEEIPMLKKIIDFVEAEPSCFERTLLKGHITGSALVINKENTAIVLLHHKKLGIWVQPGGHADGDSNVFAVALKEALEETGISTLYPLSQKIFDVDIHWIPEGKQPAHWHYDIRFIFQADSSTLISNDESLDIIWVKPENVIQKTTQRATLRPIEKWQKYFK